MEQTLKITEINGFLYSRNSFEGYLMRFKVCFVKDHQEHFLNVYTTQVDKNQFIEAIKTTMKPRVRFDRIFYSSTYENDIKMDELLNESIDGI
jgi:hypothetical protein